MSINFDEQLLQSYSDFTVIHSNITTNDYADEEKEEMMEFLISQTKDRISQIINEQVTRYKSSKDLNDLGDKVMKLLKAVPHSDFDNCKETFLTICDRALSTSQSMIARSRLVETPNRDKKLDDERRANFRLKEEIQILKQELEEKNCMIDKLEAANREKMVIEKKLFEVMSKNTTLETEVSLLKAQLSKDQKHYEWRMKETKSREEKLIRDKMALIIHELCLLLIYSLNQNDISC